MIARPRRLLFTSLVLGGALTATPAFAQAVGGDLTGFLQNLVDLLNGGVARLLAVLAVIATGIVWLMGQIDLRRAGTVVLGIIVVFGATTIVDMITGGGGAG